VFKNNSTLRHLLAICWQKLGGSIIVWGCLVFALNNFLNPVRAGQATRTAVFEEETVLYFPLIFKNYSAPIRFAVIGDYGLAGDNERDVANQVISWVPDFIITTGDNNYPDGEASTIDVNIGQYYHAYIAPYPGDYGSGAETNRFFPTLGNHDQRAINCSDGGCTGPYFDYFSLPGNERYYDFVWGPVHFFAINSVAEEPDGRTNGSNQANWLQSKLAASTATWKLVYMHHPPFSSGPHGPETDLQWDYQNWGASAVLAGHDHTYERILINEFPYFVNGLGGKSIYGFGTPVSGSQVRYNGDYGALLVEADQSQITFQFITQGGDIIDTHTLNTP